MKDKLIFDTTNSTTIADSDSVGAYVRSSDGTLITHTNVGGNDALDVNISNTSITVTATDLDIRDLDFASDSIDVSGSEVSLDSTTLAALESITVQNGAGAAAVNIQDGGNSITVDGTVELGATTLAALETITVEQGTSPWVIGDGGGSITVDGTVTVNDAALANTAISNEAETLDVANTSQNIVASILSNRKYLLAYNRDNQVMYVGAAGVTTANGFPVSPGSYIELRAGAAVDVEFVSAKVNHEIRTLQLS